GVLTDQAEALLVLRAQWVLEEEEPVRFEVAGHARGFDGRELLMAVMQQLDLVAELQAQMLEEPRHGTQVRRRLEEVRRWEARHVGHTARRLLRRLFSRRAVSSLQAGNGHLGAHTLETFLHSTARLVFHLSKVRAAGVGVSQRADACPTAQQLI